jgi:hypothetical protein
LLSVVSGDRQEGLIMKKRSKHFKFINSQTGYVIFYCSISDDLDHDKVKAELEKIKAQVAVNNGIFLETVYWEEIKEGY